MDYIDSMKNPNTNHLRTDLQKKKILPADRIEVASLTDPAAAKLSAESRQNGLPMWHSGKELLLPMQEM